MLQLYYTARGAVGTFLTFLYIELLLGPGLFYAPALVGLVLGGICVVMLLGRRLRASEEDVLRALGTGAATLDEITREIARQSRGERRIVRLTLETMLERLILQDLVDGEPYEVMRAGDDYLGRSSAFRFYLTSIGRRRIAPLLR